METIRGIVLRTVKYGDERLIVDMFTESRGRLSIVTSRSARRRAGRSAAYWQVLSQVEFQAEFRPAGGLPRPQGIRYYYRYLDLGVSPVKSTIAFFLAEFLSAALREEKQNGPLYQYIESSLQWFDEARFPTAIANFHLVFLMHLSRFIGIYPNLDGPTACFDLQGGCYLTSSPSHRYYLSGAEAMAVPRLFRMNYATAHVFKMSAAQRRRIIEVLNTYYRLHLPNFPELKSAEVLHEVFG